MDRLLEYVSNHPLLAGAAGLMALVVLGYELRQRATAASAVSPSEAVRLMNDGAVMVDIRSANQFKDGHVSGARNIPGDQIADGTAPLQKLGKDKVVITCCDSGITSGAAARKLSQLGFKQVFNLRGGLGAWRQENLPVTKG